MGKSLRYASILTLVCLVLSIATILASGCSSLAHRLVNPTYTLHDIRPRVDIAYPLSQSSIDFDFVLSVDNPNAIGLRLNRVDFTLLINDSHILDGYSDAPVRIPAHGIGDVHLRARIGYASLRSLFREIADMVQGNRASYTIQGTVDYSTAFGHHHFPLNVRRGGENRPIPPG